MSLQELREKLHLTQQQVAARLGLSQSYVSMLETGQRRLPAPLARRVVRLFKAPPTWHPLPDPFQPGRRVDPDWLARQLGALGYPGYRYLAGKTRAQNPAFVLLTALAADNLEPRAFEALPWLALRYPDMDGEWLARNAKVFDLQNRLGFVVTLARGFAEKRLDDSRMHALQNLAASLENSRLAREDRLPDVAGSKFAYETTKARRSQEAEYWNLVTGWRLEHFQYA